VLVGRDFCAGALGYPQGFWAHVLRWGPWHMGRHETAFVGCDQVVVVGKSGWVGWMDLGALRLWKPRGVSGGQFDSTGDTPAPLLAGGLPRCKRSSGPWKLCVMGLNEPPAQVRSTDAN
jgi:hypothetical protein